MSGGPIFAISEYPADTTGRLFPIFYGGGGGNASPHDQGIGVQASLSADATWELRFPVPPSVPTGTLKLRVLSLSSSGAGVVKFTVKDATVSAGSSPSGSTLTSETQSTVTWTTGSADKYIETKVPLTASPAGNDMLVIAITFNSSGTTLAVPSCHIPTIIWE